MTGKIPQQFIDDLVARIDIIDVINRRVPLKKAGHEYKACCPFHDEKTPSFTVSPTKQFYHCFGCGAHGTAIGFLMEFDHLSYPEAIETLAADIGLEVPREAAANRGPNLAPLFDLLGQAEQFYLHQLRTHADATRATAYLRQRGLSEDVTTLFRIGFAPPGWDNLNHALGTTKERLNHLRRCGLISDRDQGGTYDRLRDRIIFPIHDARGRVIGFGGRVLGDGTPKYLNSPETAVFHKGRELYGLYEAQQANRKLNLLLVVEGYMDVVALAQFGIRNAVATLGTATTAEHVEKLFRQVPEIVFCFDGDRAGRDAAWKALNTTLAFMRDGRQARFLFLPEGEDPDSLVRRHGAEQFRRMTAEAESLSGFMFRLLTHDLDLTIPEGRARLAELAKPLVAKVPAGVFRELLLEQLTQHIQIRSRHLRDPSRARKKRSHGRDVQPRSLMQQTIALILQHPEGASRVSRIPTWNAATIPGTEILTRLLESASKNPHISTAGLIEQWTDEKIKRTLGHLAGVNLDLTSESDIVRQIDDGVDRLEARARHEEYSALSARELSSLSHEEKQRLRELSSALAPKS